MKKISCLFKYSPREWEFLHAHSGALTNFDGHKPVEHNLFRTDVYSDLYTVDISSPIPFSASYFVTKTKN